jgi:predicted phage terminase large subunit-like protein
MTYLSQWSGVSLPNAKTAAKQAARRTLARRHLIEFTRWTYPRYLADPAHNLLGQYLEEVVQGRLTRLMIFAPPQHGKSELVSVRLPAFWLAHRPDDPVILSSYGASLAERHSSEARACVESQEFADLFNTVETRQDSRAKQLWRIAGHTGGMLAVGVGGPITGHGARLGIIDDPFENWRQAQSVTYRNQVWDWWRGTFRTRIWENGAIILVMTRWHEDDLAGRLIAEQGEGWTVLRLPALAETQTERDENAKLLGLPSGEDDPLGRVPGAALCPQRFSAQALAAIRRDVGAMVWHAEYQGVPRAPEGNRFKREWFRVVDEIPAAATCVRYWDKAGSSDGGDYTAGALLCTDGAQYYVADVVRGQWSDLARETVIRETAVMDGVGVTVWIEQEPGSGGLDSARATVRNLAGFVVKADKVTGDKVTRSSPFAAQCEARNVALKRGFWNGALLGELCAFPNGTHDDQVDAVSGAFNRLAEGGSVVAGSGRVVRSVF